MFFNFMKNTPLKRDRESATVSTPDEEKITSATPTHDALNDNLTVTNNELMTENNNKVNDPISSEKDHSVRTKANNIHTNSVPEIVTYEQQEQHHQEPSTSSEEILLAEEDENVFNHKMQMQETNTDTVVAPIVTSVRNVPNSTYVPFHGDYSYGSDTPIETHSTESSSHSYSSSSSYSFSSSASNSFTSHKTTPSSEKYETNSQNSFYYSDAESNEMCISQVKRQIIKSNRNKQSNNNDNNNMIMHNVQTNKQNYVNGNSNNLHKNYNNSNTAYNNSKSFIIGNSVMNDDCYYQPHNNNMYYNNQNQQGKVNNNETDVNNNNNQGYYNPNNDIFNNDNEDSFNNDDNDGNDDDHNSHNRRQDRKKRYPRFTSEYAERFRHEMVPFLRVLPYFTPCDEILETSSSHYINTNPNQNGNNASVQEKQVKQEHEINQSQKEGNEVITQQNFQSLQSEQELFTPISQPESSTIIERTAPPVAMIKTQNYENKNNNKQQQQQYEESKQMKYSRGNKRLRSANPRRHPLVLYGTYLYCRTLGKGTYSKVVLAQRVPLSALAMRDALHYNKLYHCSNPNNVSTTPNSPYQKQYSEITSNKDNNNAVLNTERASTSYAASANTFTISKNENNSENYNRISTRSVELNTPGMAALRALHSNVNGIGLGGGDSVGGGVPLVALKVFRDKDAYREACWDEVAVLRALCRPDNHISHQHNHNQRNSSESNDILGQYAITAHCPIAGDDGGAALMGYLSHVGRFVGFIEYIPHPVHPAIAFPVMGPSLLHVVRNVNKASKIEQTRYKQLSQEHLENMYGEHKTYNNQQKATEQSPNSNTIIDNKSNSQASDKPESKELLYRGLSTSLLKTVLYQILLFLQYIHARGVVHTDLKPENVLFESRIALPKKLPIYSSKPRDNRNAKNKDNTSDVLTHNQRYSDHNSSGKAGQYANNVKSCIPHYTQQVKHNLSKEGLQAEEEKQIQLMLSEQKERNNEMKMHSAQAAMKSKPYYDNESNNGGDEGNTSAFDNTNKNSPIGQRANKSNNETTQHPQCTDDADANHTLEVEDEEHQCHHDPMHNIHNAVNKSNHEEQNNNEELEEEQQQENDQKPHEQQLETKIQKTNPNQCYHYNYENNNDESSYHTECERTISHVVRVRLPLLNSVRVTDLGTAQFLANFTHRSHIDGLTLVSYDVIQTSHYRAPEVIMGVGWSRSADLFSLGCMIPELLTGECLFMPKDTLEHLALMEHIIGPFQPTQRLNEKYFQQSHNPHDQLQYVNNNENENSGNQGNNNTEGNVQSNMTRHISLDEFTNTKCKANNNDNEVINENENNENMQYDKYGNDNILREVFAINGATYSHYFNLRTNKLRWPLSEHELSEFHEEKRQEREMRRRARRRERMKQMHAAQQQQQQLHHHQHYNYNEYDENEEDDEDEEEDDELIQPFSVTRSKDYKFVKEKPTLNQILGFDGELLDLTRRLLCYHPLKRITADEALRHPYFSAMETDKVLLNL